MKISFIPYFLKFKRPFVLAHGTRLGTPLLFVKIEHHGKIGFGEASLPPYLRETQESVQEWITDRERLIESGLKVDFEALESVLLYDPLNPAASAATEMAMLNWHSAAGRGRLEQLFRTTKHRPKLSLTLTKSDLGDLTEKLKQAEDFHVLKLKLTGGPDDVDFVRAVQKESNLPFCLDANQGFLDKEDAAHFFESIDSKNCLLVEQPLSKIDHEGHNWLRERIEPPVVADESIQSYRDLVKFHSAYDGVNIKLMKCGGLMQAKTMLAFLNDLYSNNSETQSYLKIIGCMSESSLGVQMAARLLSGVHMADLDAPYLNSNDPFSGFEIKEKRITIADRPIQKEGFFS